LVVVEGSGKDDAIGFSLDFESSECESPEVESDSESVLDLFLAGDEKRDRFSSSSFPSDPLSWFSCRRKWTISSSYCLLSFR